ncbi:protein-tyrosine phosphatase family protein [Pontivivens ytuae]|uniref:Dual specificity protein phosphatase family protein n=1 Tax=Pontivivens ytuae TaxID=2789856 RepID=A0A7S9LNC3_9RHOB|nr:dual specificity protein phosphatase family protein [Pontivivens ytuae]QPH52274.1 dual specificity protein phosphatase family protein [Pontivivens ytuae]
MKPSIYLIDADLPGRLFIMPRPSAEWLMEDMAHFRSLGIGTIVSMLEVDEMAELSLRDEPRCCCDAGMEFLHFPILDFGLPDRAGFRDLIEAVVERLEAGQSVAVHCRAGIGRSGMLACCVLARFVGSADEAVETVCRCRGTSVPDTTEQRAFIESMVGELQG